MTKARVVVQLPPGVVLTDDVRAKLLHGVQQQLAPKHVCDDGCDHDLEKAEKVPELRKLPHRAPQAGVDASMKLYEQLMTKMIAEIGDVLVGEQPIEKAGPFVGPRGGLWEDPAHTIPWKAHAHNDPTPVSDVSRLPQTNNEAAAWWNKRQRWYGKAGTFDTVRPHEEAIIREHLGKLYEKAKDEYDEAKKKTVASSLKDFRAAGLKHGDRVWIRTSNIFSGGTVVHGTVKEGRGVPQVHLDEDDATWFGKKRMAWHPGWKPVPKEVVVSSPPSNGG